MHKNSCGICHNPKLKPVINLQSPCLLSDSDFLNVSVDKVFCENCHMLMTHPQSWSDMNARYETEYTLAAKEVGGEVKREVDGSEITRSALAASWITSLIREVGGDVFNKRILEIGAGTGALASVLKDSHSCHVTCVEPNQSAREICLGRGIDCWKDISEVSGSFDFIIFFTSLEHMEQPLDVLKWADSKLDHSGHILIVVPESFDGTYDYFYGDHLYHYSKFSLNHLMMRGGFKCEFAESGKGWSRGVFAAIYNKNGNHSYQKINDDSFQIIENRINKWLRVFKTLSNELASLKNKNARLVVFGAGQIFSFLGRYIPEIKSVDVIVDDNTHRFPDAIQQSQYFPSPGDVVILLFQPSSQVTLEKLQQTKKVISFWSFYENSI